MFEYNVRLLGALVGVFFYLILASGTAYSTHKGETREQLSTQVNATTVTIVAGSLHSTSARLVEDMGLALNDGANQRILPVLGFGSVQNISDVLYLKGVDIGIVHADVLEAVRRDNYVPDIAQKVSYIAELCNENIYIIAGKGINSVNDLAGTTVNFGPYGGDDGYATPALLFKTLGVKVNGAHISQTTALEKIAIGEMSATVVMGNDLKLILARMNARDNLRLLPLSKSGLPEQYVQTTLTSADLPGILREGSKLDTVAVRLVLISNNWPSRHKRHKKVARFVESFFSKFKEMQQAPFDPEWKKVKLASTLADWKRFEASETWLAQNEDEQTVATLKGNFETFLAKSGSTKLESLSEEQQAKMFSEFLAWGKNTSEAKISVRLTSATGVGKKLGTLTLMNTEILVGSTKEKALVLRPDLKGMRPGAYAFHVHQKANCGPGEKNGKMVPGLAAGGHLWLTGTGTFEGQTFGSHLGDLPDIVVDPDGTATKAVVAARLTLSDVVNRAVTLHATSNDKSPRHACGVIK